MVVAIFKPPTRVFGQPDGYPLASVHFASRRGAMKIARHFSAGQVQ